MAKLFISQDRLDAWNAEQKVRLDDSRLTLVELDRSFQIRPAVLFLKVSGDEEDPNNLLGRVKAEAELDAMGADVYMNSVIVGDTAYEVQTGFLGDPEPKSGG
jgi:hypothetical protein